MKIFLKKYIKPIFQIIGLYASVYNVYFFLINFINKISNYCFKIFFKTAPILLYHRVANVSEDPIKLCVTPACFEKHLQFLKKHYDILPLSELSRRLMAGNLNGNEAAITFDDGYKDNLTNALPLLEKYNIPATIFVTTSSLGEKASFEWDLEYAEVDRATFLNEEEILILSNHKLIEIGAHTNTHSRLSDLTEAEQKDEILKSKIVLEKITGKKITAFAYPFGGIYDFNNSSKLTVKKIGFLFAYSTAHVLAKNTSDSYCIPRINIRECTVSDLSKMLLTYGSSFFKSNKK